MMYNEKLAMAIKAEGKVLREFGDQVYIPFGSEYSLYFKNLNTVRAVVSIEIDGEDIGGGQGFVVHPGDSIDIERFVKNNDKGNRFRFIERTGAVEKHRGVGAEDGLIRVTYKFAKPKPAVMTYASDIIPTSYYPQGMRGGITTTATYSSSIHDGAAACDVGITVEGSVSDQKFQTVASFTMEDTEYAMVMKLVGETAGNKSIREPITVKAKPTCKTCGTKNKATSKFCAECGTSLQIVA